MNEIQKYTQAIRDNGDIDYGTIVTLSKIDKLSAQLETENAELMKKLAENDTEIERLNGVITDIYREQ